MKGNKSTGKAKSVKTIAESRPRVSRMSIQR